MQIRVEKITPDVAKALLVGNTANRNISKLHVARLAREMELGRWQTSHQGIAVATCGRILDGQHRLHAIVSSGVTVTMAVARDVPEDTFDVIDLNNKVRKIRDVWQLTRGQSLPNQMVAAARIILALRADAIALSDGGRRESLGLGRIAMDIEDVDQIMNLFGDELKWSHSALTTKGLRYASSVAAVAYALPASRVEIENYVIQLNSGVGMSENQVAVRNALARASGNGGAARTPDVRRNMTILMMRAIYAHLQGARLSRLFMREAGGSVDKAFSFFVGARKKAGLPI
jgi:hypothetical protein